MASRKLSGSFSEGIVQLILMMSAPLRHASLMAYAGSADHNILRINHTRDVKCQEGKKDRTDLLRILLNDIMLRRTDSEHKEFDVRVDSFDY